MLQSPARVFLSLSLLCMLYSATGQTANPTQYKYVFTVAKDGSGEYSTIQEAINAMRVFPLAPITLYIKNGVYNEKIELPSGNTDVSFIGESVDKTMITYNDHSGKGKLNTFNSYTAKISGNRFRAENISFVNAAGPVGQAVAMHVEADQAVFINCRFIGHQDTIFAGGENSRQLFVNCYAEGTTDFIFGPATAVFLRCTIRAKSNSYITAANTVAGKKFGLVFLDCTIEADSSVSKLYLGRPWRAHAKTVFIRCSLPQQIHPAGWHNWDNAGNEKTVFYAEYANTGKGASYRQRVSWSTQLTDAAAKEYSLENIFAAQNNAGSNENNWFKATLSTPFEWPVKQ